MITASGFHRVSKSRPCPICGRPDWCLLAHDGSAAICPRTPEGAKRRVGEAGYLHCLNNSHAVSQQVVTVRLNSVRPKMPLIADQCRQAISFSLLNELHQALGVTTASLEALGVGWFEPLRCWTFPMKNADGQIVGIRTRTQSGRKFAIKGSRQGLFFTADLQTAATPWLVAEGASDCAAGLDLGFPSLGLPSANGGIDLLTRLVARHKPTALILCADNDSVGYQGMLQAAAHCRLFVRDIRIITPPSQIKDLRDWMRAGLTHDFLQKCVHTAAPFDLHMSAIVRSVS